MSSVTFKQPNKLLEKRENEIKYSRHLRTLEDIKKGNSHFSLNVIKPAESTNVTTTNHQQKNQQTGTTTVAVAPNHRSPTGRQVKQSTVESPLLYRNHHEAREAERIAMENAKIQQKIQGIMSLQVPGATPHNSSIISETNGLVQGGVGNQSQFSLLTKHAAGRKRKDQDILVENRSIGERLKKVKSVFDIKKWQQERSNVEKYLGIITQHAHSAKTQTGANNRSIVSEAPSVRGAREINLTGEKKQFIYKKAWIFDNTPFQKFYVEMYIQNLMFYITAESVEQKISSYETTQKNGIEMLAIEFKDDPELLLGAARIDEVAGKIVILKKKGPFENGLGMQRKSESTSVLPRYLEPKKVYPSTAEVAASALPPPPQRKKSNIEGVKERKKETKVTAPSPPINNERERKTTISAPSQKDKSSNGAVTKVPTKPIEKDKPSEEMDDEYALGDESFEEEEDEPQVEVKVEKKNEAIPKVEEEEEKKKKKKEEEKEEEDFENDYDADMYDDEDDAKDDNTDKKKVALKEDIKKEEGKQHSQPSKEAEQQKKEAEKQKQEEDKEEEEEEEEKQIKDVKEESQQNNKETKQQPAKEEGEDSVDYDADEFDA